MQRVGWSSHAGKLAQNGLAGNPKTEIRNPKGNGIDANPEGLRGGFRKFSRSDKNGF
jgi:hypothetical protein